jgi:type I restriction enzyme S subunit
MSELYQLPDGWVWRKLGDVTSLVGGGTPSRNVIEYWENGNIVWLSPTDLGSIGEVCSIASSKDRITKLGLEKSSARLLPIGTVLFSSRATIGKIAINTIELTTNQGFTNFICEDSLNNQYLAYCLVNFTKEITTLSNSTTFKEVSKSALKEFEIPVPPLTEQKRIVQKLDALFERIDKAIALLQKNIDAADNFKQNYEPVELTKYVNFIGGSQPPKSEFSDKEREGYVRLIQIRDYKSDNNIVYVKKTSVRRFCNKDDVMIGRYGPPVFQILRGLDGAYNVALMKAEPNEEFICKDFLFLFLKNPSIQNYIIGLSQRSAGQSGVNKEALEKYLIALPAMNKQKEIVLYLNQVSAQIKQVKLAQQQKMQSLLGLKSSILDQAFHGKL